MISSKPGAIVILAASAFVASSAIVTEPSAGASQAEERTFCGRAPDAPGPIKGNFVEVDVPSASSAPQARLKLYEGNPTHRRRLVVYVSQKGWFPTSGVNYRLDQVLVDEAGREKLRAKAERERRTNVVQSSGPELLDCIRVHLDNQVAPVSADLIPVQKRPGYVFLFIPPIPRVQNAARGVEVFLDRVEAGGTKGPVASATWQQGLIGSWSNDGQEASDLAPHHLTLKAGDHLVLGDIGQLQVVKILPDAQNQPAMLLMKFTDGGV
jgi:hypothetical protein